MSRTLHLKFPWYATSKRTCALYGECVWRRRKGKSANDCDKESDVSLCELTPDKVVLPFEYLLKSI